MKYSLILSASLALAFASVACGSSNPPPASSPATTTASDEHKEHHKGGHGDEHKDLAPPLKEFHHVLAPVWHSDPGPTRIEKTCTNVKAMQEKATATSDAELIAGVKDLEAACAKDGKPEVEAKLHTVHERFHALAKIEKHDEKK